LRQALGDPFTVTVADPSFAKARRMKPRFGDCGRGARLFETTGIWRDVADEAQPILDMW